MARKLAASVSLTVFFLALTVPLSAPAKEDLGVPKGITVPRVVCLGDPQQSYALYLPADYTSSKKWPILYAFDPMARGTVPLEIFREAAEKYGYIVVGSNNSRNGPSELGVMAMRAMWEDAHQRFSLDDGRAYATGFSGAARVACGLGLAAQSAVAGVIAVGGGFPIGVEPASSNPFAFYGIVGLRDLNYTEMKDLAEKMEKLGITHRLEVRDAPHEWPPKEICREAIEWMELQAIRRGKKEKDEGFIEGLYAARLERARAEERTADLEVAYHHYQNIVADFQGLRDISEARARVEELSRSKELEKLLKKAQSREKRRQWQDSQYAYKFNNLRFAIRAGAPDPTEVRRLTEELQIPRLKRLMETKKETDAVMVAERQIQRILISSYEEGAMYLSQNKNLQALACLEVAAQAAPDSAFIQYTLARALALNHQKRKALESLSRAAELGFKNPDSVEKESAFDFLREDARFLEAVGKIRAASAEAKETH